MPPAADQRGRLGAPGLRSRRRGPERDAERDFAYPGGAHRAVDRDSGTVDGNSGTSVCGPELDPTHHPCHPAHRPHLGDAAGGSAEFAPTRADGEFTFRTHVLDDRASARAIDRAEFERNHDREPAAKPAVGGRTHC